MEKKKKKKSTQCEFCSLADFGSKSAENKAVSVLLLSADSRFVLRFEKVGPERVPSRQTAEARSPGCLCNNTGEESEQEENRAGRGRVKRHRLGGLQRHTRGSLRFEEGGRRWRTSSAARAASSA